MSAPLPDQVESTTEVDELTARRQARGVNTPDTPGRVDHRTRRDYASVLELLADADRLVDDLAATGSDALLVPVTELGFTSRRLRALLDAATVELRRAGGA